MGGGRWAVGDGRWAMGDGRYGPRAHKKAKSGVSTRPFTRLLPTQRHSEILLFHQRFRNSAYKVP